MNTLAARGQSASFTNQWPRLRRFEFHEPATTQSDKLILYSSPYYTRPASELE